VCHMSDAILTPMDAIKQKMQLGVRPYKGMIACLRIVIRAEGFFALYASYTTTLLMNVPYNALYFTSYESLRRLFKRGSEKEFDVLAHCLAGGGAGSVAAALTTPFDVAKTRLQTQGDVGKKIQRNDRHIDNNLAGRGKGWIDERDKTSNSPTFYFSSNLLDDI